jgi:bacteriocin-like protein
MLNQLKNGNQRAKAITAKNLQEYQSVESDTSKQAIAEISDEQLEQITGGGSDPNQQVRRYVVIIPRVID